jgi:hypothetical protein
MEEHVTFPPSDTSLDWNDCSSHDEDLEKLMSMKGMTWKLNELLVDENVNDFFCKGQVEYEGNVILTCRKNAKDDSKMIDKQRNCNSVGSNFIPSYESQYLSEIESPELLCFPIIENMPYAHGGYFGTAPFFLLEPHWMSILKTLMPDVYTELSDALRTCPIPKLIQWAENNPVVAAYGTVQSNIGSKVAPLEWDVFLDPRLVSKIQDVSDNITRLSSDFHDTHQYQIRLRGLENERKALSTELVETMLIAHGTLSQLLLEQTGIAKEYNYSCVKQTQRTLGGGMFVYDWVAIYTAAIMLGNMSIVGQGHDSVTWEQRLRDISIWNYRSVLDSNDKNKTSRSKADKPPFSCSQSVDYIPRKSLKDLVNTLRRFVNGDTSNKSPLRVVLDLKSRHVPKVVWAVVIDHLTEIGISIDGVGSFVLKEIRGLSQLCRTPVPLVEINFFHSAGDLQYACHKGLVRSGDVVYFNGGSLLWESPKLVDSLDAAFQNCFNFDPIKLMKKYRLLPFCYSGKEDSESCSTLMSYKTKFDLQIGIYVQEFNIDPCALHLLVQYCNNNPGLLQAGMVWGGFNGVILRGIQPGRCTFTDGFHAQRYAGRSWNYSHCVRDIRMPA